MQETNVFTNDYALRLEGGNGTNFSIATLKGFLTADNTYTVAFDAYEKTAGSICVLLMNEAGAQEGSANFNVVDNGNGTKRYSATFKATATYNQVWFYMLSNCDLYLANLILTEAEPVAGLVDKQITGTKNWSDCNVGGSGTQVATPTAAVGQKGFDTQALQFSTATPNANMVMFDFQSMTSGDPNFKSVTFTVYYYVSEMNGSGLMINLDNSTFLKFTDQDANATAVGYHAVSFTIDKGFQYFCCYFDNSTTGTVVIGSVDYVVNTQVAPNA